MRECVMDMRGRGHAGGENAGVWQAGQRQTRIAPPPDRSHSPSRCPLRGRVLGSARAASRLVSRQAHAPVPKLFVFIVTAQRGRGVYQAPRPCNVIRQYVFSLRSATLQGRR